MMVNGTFKPVPPHCVGSVKTKYGYFYCEDKPIKLVTWKGTPFGVPVPLCKRHLKTCKKFEGLKTEVIK